MQLFIDFTRAPTNGDANEYLRSITEVLDLGYDISEPYVLRALEAYIRNSLLFADDDTVCDAMKPESKVGGALNLGCTGDEIVSLTVTKTKPS